MMKLLKRDTAAALDKAKASLAADEAKIAELGRQREDLLVGDDVAAILTLDRSIEDRGRSAAVFRDRITRLEAQLAADQRAERRRQYDDAVSAVSALLPKRNAAARAFEQAIATLAASLRAFDETGRAIVNAWPDGVPSHPMFGADYFTGSSRAVEQIRECFDTHPARRREALSRILAAGETATGFSRLEIERGAELIETLRTWQPPEPDDEPIKEAA